MITLSIVNHGHDDFLPPLFNDLLSLQEISKVILINNIQNNYKINLPSELKSKTLIMNNKITRGFSSNHNAAFDLCSSEYFCIINPDIRIKENPFPKMLKLFNDKDVALVGPAVISNKGTIEDSARRYPTLFNLTRRKLGLENDNYNFRLNDATFKPDWIAGMFLLLKSNYFNKVGRLDEKNYYMYCEDIDLCIRLKKLGKKVLLEPSVFVIHNARRTSRKNIKYFLFHLKSMLNYYLKHHLKIK